MVYCQALTFGGSRCGKDATNQSYFWYYDPMQRVDKTFHLCQDHSNQIVRKCIEKEVGFNGLIGWPRGRLYDNIESLKVQKRKSANFSEQRDAIKQAKENGSTPPKFKSLQKIDNEISELYRKVKKIKELKNIERNHTCRRCGYELKEPYDLGDQIAGAYGHADFHSGRGHRREVLLFHSECGISWLLANVLLTDKELKYVRPQRFKQGVLI